jgi:hypothetical protein
VEGQTLLVIREFLAMGVAAVQAGTPGHVASDPALAKAEFGVPRITL